MTVAPEAVHGPGTGTCDIEVGARKCTSTFILCCAAVFFDNDSSWGAAPN